MKSEEPTRSGIDGPSDESQEPAHAKIMSATQVVTADAVQAEEVPTIPLDSLETIHSLQPEISIHSVAATRAVSIPAPLVVRPAEYRRSFGEWLQIWLDGLRLAYLPLSLMPILLGTVLAWTRTINKQSVFGQPHLVRIVLIVIVALLIQVGAHLINDYYDYLRGIDASNILGPGGLIQQGYVRPGRILAVGLASLGLGAILGAVLALSSGTALLMLLLFGLIAVLVAYFYSATPWALSSLALGELVGGVVFGPMVTVGAYMLQSRDRVDAHVLLYSLPLGLFAAAVIHANNLRDIEGDLYAGKHTLATLLGAFWSRISYLLLVLAAYLIIITQGAPAHTPHLILLVFWTFPGLVVAVTGVLRTKAAAGFHLVMHQTLRLETFFTLLLCVALIIISFIPVLPVIPDHLLPF